MTLNILAAETYFGGSHRQWIEGLKKFSQHKIKIISLDPKHWKWRMHGGAVSLADLANSSTEEPDILLVSSLLDVALFKSLTKWKKPIVLYFHENQFAYPQSSRDKDKELERDIHYQFINFSSALTADRIFFNSKFNFDTFIDGAQKLIQKMPDNQFLDKIDLIRMKSEVCPLGFDFPAIGERNSPSALPTILWSHRWDEDKNPEGFYKFLVKLKERQFEFNLALLGTPSRGGEKWRKKIVDEFSDHIVVQGKQNREEYYHWLSQSDILPVTSHHDFFGISVVEAIQQGVYPLLPNRLAYPELIPQQWHNDVLYETEEELLEKVLCWSPGLLGELSNSTERWGWHKIAPILDQAFLDTVQRS